MLHYFISRFKFMFYVSLVYDLVKKVLYTCKYVVIIVIIILKIIIINTIIIIRYWMYSAIHY